MAKFAQQRVLVIGDLMLDEFITGKVSRISPEAPVPVVEVQKTEFYPGGAANVVRNLCEFTSQSAIAGIVGDDAPGGQLMSLLEKRGADTTSVMRSKGRPTTLKTRIVARHQQVVRVDRESKSLPTNDERGWLVERLRKVITGYNAVIIEDYAKGLLDQGFVSLIIKEARRAGVIVTADPNPYQHLDWSGATAVKPNRLETFQAAGLHPSDELEAVHEAAAALQAKWATEYLLVTLGEDGMMLYDGSDTPYHSPTKAMEVFDVSGAGDTSIAVFTLALAAGASSIEATEMANHAAGVVVGKLGTGIITPDELIASFKGNGGKA